jgi:hypothetical protein
MLLTFLATRTCHHEGSRTSWPLLQGQLDLPRTDLTLLQMGMSWTFFQLHG